MPKIGIVTDNTCDIDPKQLEEMGIGYVSLYVKWKGKFERAVDIDTDDFYEFLITSDYIPATSQPTPQDFEEVYKQMLKDYDELISVHLSGKLSGTYNSARIAAKEVDEKRIHIVESYEATWGLGYLVLELKKLIDSGDYNVEELKSFVEHFQEKVNVYFTVGSLNYLAKGGRIGKATAFVGSMLNIKPLLKLENGEILPVKRIRGYNKIIKELTSLAMEEKGKGELKNITVEHTGSLKLGGDLLDELVKLGVPREKIIFEPMDIIIGMHLGPDSGGIVTTWE
ncbi:MULTISPECIES: DegV family protein [Petrotoga]|uniref:DegV family protein with EDD domain n=2 Tax=Petrotoga sibirica TaxID=156202 RepID=A0A4V3GR39_9BACT|nr:MULTISPECIES: DegV family protein [Petrotoga]POZ88865.1 fatty acid-binding protein DegV [Petrotoga sibirica DSM 13575]POZ90983.1 fatty acid-binding protein DegV [Petrotoga sp. SL27]TDX17493.1 DegV family protein with EDD domain [Petrotoga sibirica]